MQSVASRRDFPLGPLAPWTWPALLGLWVVLLLVAFLGETHVQSPTNPVPWWIVVLFGTALLPAGLLDEIKAFHNGFREKIKPLDQAMIEIITAQSFQDLTGQVSGKLTVLIERVEQELLQVLSDNIPEGKGHWQEPEPEGDAALLNGPAVEPADDTTVQNQQQVDDLLAKLGF